MKYGKYEYERTYLLESNYLLNKKIERIKIIRDKYIEGTKLRLREIRENNETKFKLTQKEELKPVKQGVLKINTLYLTKSEFDKMNTLEGVEIEKERHIVQIDRTRIGIDKITFNDKTILIAEIEFDTEFEMNTFSMPLDCIMEITGNHKYNGFEIAKQYSKYKSE